MSWGEDRRLACPRRSPNLACLGACTGDGSPSGDRGTTRPCRSAGVSQTPSRRPVWQRCPTLPAHPRLTLVHSSGTALLAAVSADWYEQEHRQGTVDPDPSLVRHCHRVGCNALNRTRGSAGRPLLFFRPADQSPRPPPRLSLPPPAGERLPYPLRRQEALAYAGVRPIWARATCDRSHRRFSHILAFAIECAWPDPLFGSACLATLCRCRVGECL